MEETLRLPHNALTLVFFIYQGTVFASYKTLLSWEEAVEIPVALVGLIMIGYGFPYVTWKWLSYRSTPEASEEQTAPGDSARAQWHANSMTTFFSPQGQWTPPAIAKRFGFFFDDFTESASYFRLILFAFSHVIGLVAAIQATPESVQCVIQTAICAILCLAMSSVFAFLRPMRWTCLSYSMSAILFIQGILFFATAFAPQHSEILSFCFLIVCLFYCALWVLTEIRGYYIHDTPPPALISFISAKFASRKPMWPNFHEWEQELMSRDENEIGN